MRMETGRIGRRAARPRPSPESWRWCCSRGFRRLGLAVRRLVRHRAVPGHGRARSRPHHAGAVRAAAGALAGVDVGRRGRAGRAWALGHRCRRSGAPRPMSRSRMASASSPMRMAFVLGSGSATCFARGCTWRWPRWRCRALRRRATVVARAQCRRGRVASSTREPSSTRSATATRTPPSSSSPSGPRWAWPRHRGSPGAVARRSRSGSPRSVSSLGFSSQSRGSIIAAAAALVVYLVVSRDRARALRLAPACRRCRP